MAPATSNAPPPNTVPQVQIAIGVQLGVHLACGAHGHPVNLQANGGDSMQVTVPPIYPSIDMTFHHLETSMGTFKAENGTHSTAHHAHPTCRPRPAHHHSLRGQPESVREGVL